MEGFNAFEPKTPEAKRARATENEQALAAFEERVRVGRERELEKLRELEGLVETDPRYQAQVEEQRNAIERYDVAMTEQAAAMRRDTERLNAEADEQQHEAA